MPMSSEAAKLSKVSGVTSSGAMPCAEQWLMNLEREALAYRPASRDRKLSHSGISGCRYRPGVVVIPALLSALNVRLRMFDQRPFETPAAAGVTRDSIARSWPGVAGIESK